jgi:hypothetical protein
MALQICHHYELCMFVSHQSLGSEGWQEFVQCPRCHYRVYGEIVPVDEIEVDYDDFCLEIYWTGESAGIKEIALLRKLDPSLHDRSLQKCVESIRKTPMWRIMNLSKRQCDNIATELNKHSMKFKYY